MVWELGREVHCLGGGRKGVWFVGASSPEHPVSREPEVRFGIAEWGFGISASPIGFRLLGVRVRAWRLFWVYGETQDVVFLEVRVWG